MTQDGQEERPMGEDRLREQRAAEEASDPDRLLPGEDPTATDPDNARVWVQAYTELLDYKRTLLRVTEEKLARMRDEPAHPEGAGTDNGGVEAGWRRVERRLAVWRAGPRHADAARASP